MSLRFYFDFFYTQGVYLFIGSVLGVFLLLIKKFFRVKPWLEMSLFIESPFIVIGKKDDIVFMSKSFKDRYLIKIPVSKAKVNNIEVSSLGLTHQILEGLSKVSKKKLAYTQAIEIGLTKKALLKAIFLKRFSLRVIVIEELTPLQLASAAHKNFIANASHELRTPITIIKGFVETLMELPEVSLSMIEDIFDKILRSCSRMEATIKNLMILINLDQGSETRIKSFDILTLIDSCFHTLKCLHPDIRYEIICKGKQLMLVADGDLIELALMNLLQNAIKYSHEQVDILVECYKEGSDVVINISDRGIGIPQDKCAQVFERFFTVDKALSKRLGGVGLGLSIVRSVVDKHKGTIEAYPRQGGGTTFSMKLPSKG